MEPLDDLAYFQRLDQGQMLERIAEFPEQCQLAWERAAAFAWPQAPEGLTSVVIAGMGGSAIAGELVAELAAASSPVPVVVHRNYGLPAFAGPRTLVIASSYSGDTEETLSATREALRRGATVVGLASGGEVARLADEAGLPLFPIRYRSSPRAALAHSLLPLLCFFQHLGLLGDQQATVAGAVSVMQDMREAVGAAVPARANLAKQLAHHFYGRLALVYGAGLLASVAYRWKTQLNENTKAWAFYEALPEMNHNAILGYQVPDELAAVSFCAILQSRLDVVQNCERAAVTAEVLGTAGIRHQVIEAQGATVLAQMLSTIHLGDYVSFYLAALYGIDPTPIPNIDLLKERLHEADSRRESGASPALHP